ncbi:hypothetical protein GCM10022198_23040 [Klugiella xanthotipulae]|uniref:Uncharacterized protein n=1 Tax=Klugiella xanthotipulae TaxID=244735 RepID=A0A543I5V8_9MICO|nr:hypothetical protein [Klugiella xanthotipulae]TQM65968.1 hypothetical protein FB466_0788 [Klugiella xanthotipulae]
MGKYDDQALLEAVKTHRERLRGAFLFGSLGSRRVASTLANRMFVSVILAAVACAVCAGVSFVTTTLQAQKDEKDQVTTTTVPAEPTPAVTNPAENPAPVPAPAAPVAPDPNSVNEEEGGVQ